MLSGGQVHVRKTYPGQRIDDGNRVLDLVRVCLQIFYSVA